MKLTITENQLNEIINILSEKYVEDPYFVDNDIYEYQPTQAEIEMFDKIDKPVYSDFRGFDVKKDPNRFDPNKNFGKEIKFKREKKPSGKNYTGRAKIVYTYPGGIQTDVKDGIGPVAVVKDKLKRIQNLRTKDAPFFSIKYEIIDDNKKKIFEAIDPSEAYDECNARRNL
jgi:hypothetical protein